MSKKSYVFQVKKSKRLPLLLAVIFVFTCTAASAAVTTEVPEAIYTGIDNATVTLKNLDYTDVKNSNTWAKKAIYETGALNIFKGYGDKQFGLANPISKEQAIAIAYRVAGREADAQKAAEALDNARQSDVKKKNAISMWSDGYLQLAANEGLITQKELQDALNEDQTSLEPGVSFFRGAPAQRQDMAIWMAKALKMAPVYGQNKIFNSYNDWKNADPIKVPYIEAILQNNIMNGDGAGNFSPTKTVTREQAAQIVKNAESVIFPTLKYEKKVGTIEDKSTSVDLSQGDSVTSNILSVRNSNGKLHKIDAQYLTDTVDPNKNEQVGIPLPGTEKELVVYKYGRVGKSNLLSKGDRIEYIVAPDNTVKFINVISSTTDTKYIAAQINSVDPANLLLNVTQLFQMDYPDAGVGKVGNLYDNSNGLVMANYRYSNDATFVIDGKKAVASDLKPNMTVVLTLKGNIVTAVNSENFDLNGGEGRVVKGVVEENSPQLGYITLYGENGAGYDPEAPNVLKTFNYINQNGINVYKNHQKAKIEDIEPGDSVFLKLDDKLNVYELSAVPNYTHKHAKVISKRPASIALEFDDGTQQVLSYDSSVPVILDSKIVGYDSLKDGDNVQLLLNVTNKEVRLKELTIEPNQNLISNVYKGKLSYFDDLTDKVVLLNLEKLDKGQWVRADQKGISEIGLADKYKVYADNENISVQNANKSYKDQDAYIAAEKTFGKEEKAVLISFRNQDNAENLIDDSIANAESGSGVFSLAKATNNVKYGDGTIIVKDDRLVLSNSLSPQDVAYIVANRDNNSGEYFAGVIQVNERINNDFVQIYRGRIKAMNENKDFTVESFSQLKGLTWEYANTPKTFKITYDTRILGDSGLIAQRDFMGYGDNSYIGRSVYILANDINAVLVSTAPFGPDGVNAKGEIYEVTGSNIGSEGTILDEPTGIKLRNSKIYDMTKHLWVDSKDMTLNILKNSMILKNNTIAKPSDLTKGDVVKVYKKGNNETGDVYLVMVEG